VGEVERRSECSWPSENGKRPAAQLALHEGAFDEKKLRQAG